MRNVLIGIILAIIILTGFLYLRNRNALNSAQPSYETVRVEKGNIEIKVLSTGTIQPYTRVEVSSSVNGRIDRVDVDEGDVVKKGDILAWISSEERVSLMDAARSALESAHKTNDIEALKEAEMAYEIADRSYKPVPLTNSISGEVINRSCEPGQNVSNQSVLFVIADRLVARVEVDEADIGKIKLGQETWIVLDAFPDERLNGKVTKISREGQLVSDVVVYDVMVDPLRVPRHWASGMTANVEFIVERKDSVLVIPKSTVREREGKSFVMVFEERPTPLKIETGITDGRVIEVTNGLKEGDRILKGDIENVQGKRNDFRPPISSMMRRPR